MSTLLLRLLLALLRFISSWGGEVAAARGSRAPALCCALPAAGSLDNCVYCQSAVVGAVH